jgi:hypothetical protein
MQCGALNLSPHTPQTIQNFRLQKKIIIIMMGCRNTESCKKLFINLKILPFPPQYIFSLLLFMIRCKYQSAINFELYHFDTRQHANFHEPSVNVTKFQKGLSNLGAKVFNMLPSNIKIESDNPKKFEMALQNFLYENSFYSLDEHFLLSESKR